eukprot:GFYU01004404.1.p1 GENE.GFYU01004404.1~~GFYU01004404.1.p1  ORF type:complete len:130 (+),score=26.87 GFYU01004404.1:646-1035(+)
MLLPPGMRLKVWENCVITWNYWTGDTLPVSDVYYNTLKAPLCVKRDWIGSVAFMSTKNADMIKKEIWFDENKEVLQCAGLGVIALSDDTSRDDFSGIPLLRTDNSGIILRPGAVWMVLVVIPLLLLHVM